MKMVKLLIVFMFRGYPFNLFLDSDLNVKKTVPGHLGAEQIRVFAEK